MAGTREFVLSPPKVSLISELGDFCGDQILSCVLGCVCKESGKLVAAGVLAGSHCEEPGISHRLGHLSVGVSF